jgi:hypothetical protein
MGRLIDDRLWAAWRARLARYERWAGTVAAFCGREGVSAAVFYQRRRKLDNGPRANRSPRCESANAGLTPRFLPVRIEPSEPVEIELPNGVRVRVPLGAGRTLEAVIAAAARCDVAAAAEEPGAC